MGPYKRIYIFLYFGAKKMSSPLEKLPFDVLQHIAVLLASSSSPFLVPPVTDVLHLMLTGPVLYEALNMKNAPHVYARIFCAKFDAGAILCKYRCSLITDSSLAAELVHRCRLLQRSKRGDVSSQNLLTDLSIALWMYLESDGLNERQLLQVGFPDFILSVAKSHLKGPPPPSRETFKYVQQALIGKIIVWLLCFALSRHYISKMPRHSRKELYTLIFPYILSSEKHRPLSMLCPNDPSPYEYPCLGDKPGIAYLAAAQDGRLRLPNIPYPCFAAVNLAFIIFESEPLKIPPHLRETRSMLQGIEPIKSDFKTFAAYETPIFGDTLDHFNHFDSNVGSGPQRNALHDLEFRQLMLQMPLNPTYPEIRYSFGTMTALWEGVFRTIDAPGGSQATDISVFIKPIQCALHEYVNDGKRIANRNIEDLSLSDISLNKDGSELYLRGCTYRKLPRFKEHQSDCSDVILLGQTLENHDRAWGGYKFWGLVDNDGKVTLKRSAKGVGGFEGVWMFEGRLKFGSVLVGRWRVTGGPDNVYNGIFSLKRM